LVAVCRLRSRNQESLAVGGDIVAVSAGDLHGAEQRTHLADFKRMGSKSWPSRTGVVRGDDLEREAVENVALPRAEDARPASRRLLDSPERVIKFTRRRRGGFFRLTNKTAARNSSAASGWNSDARRIVLLRIDEKRSQNGFTRI